MDTLLDNECIRAQLQDLLIFSIFLFLLNHPNLVYPDGEQQWSNRDGSISVT